MRELGEVILAVRLGGEVCVVRQAEVPTEKIALAALKGRADRLEFVDSGGDVRSYDLASVYDEGERCLSLSVRVNTRWGVQVDALLTGVGDERRARQLFENLQVKGVRFQPFFLPERKVEGERQEARRGLFSRGLHFAGLVTPGNVSLMCMCDRCRKTFRLRSYHSGFAEQVYFYCSTGQHVLACSAHLRDAPPLAGAGAGPPDPLALRRFHDRLPACEKCEGTFRYLNSLRCPHCAEPYIDFVRHPDERPREYYYNVLYGDSVQHLGG